MLSKLLVCLTGMRGAGKSTIAEGLKSKGYEIINLGNAVRGSSRRTYGERKINKLLMAKRRIFHIAKELNISHTEILSFLEGKGIVVASHMAPIDEDVYKLVLSEFHKDKESVERYRKEQVRREIHDTRILEQQKANKKLNLLSLKKSRADH